jgi:hypothetical protein
MQDTNFTLYYNIRLFHIQPNIIIDKRNTLYYTVFQKEVQLLPVSLKNARVATTLDKDTLRKVAKLSEIEDRTVSSMIAVLVKEALRNREGKK